MNPHDPDECHEHHHFDKTAQHDHDDIEDNDEEKLVRHARIKE